MSWKRRRRSRKCFCVCVLIVVVVVNNTNAKVSKEWNLLYEYKMKEKKTKHATHPTLVRSRQADVKKNYPNETPQQGKIQSSHRS